MARQTSRLSMPQLFTGVTVMKDKLDETFDEFLRKETALQDAQHELQMKKIELIEILIDRGHTDLLQINMGRLRRMMARH